MSVSEEKNTYRYWGIFFITIYLTLLLRKVPRYGIDSALWYCDFIMLFAGIAFLADARKYLSTFLLQALIVQTPWIVDAMMVVLFDRHYLGTVDYLFQNYPPFEFILAMRHFLLIPILLIYFLKENYDDSRRFHVLIAVISYIFLTSLSLLLSTPEANANCAFEACLAILPQFESLFSYHLFFLGVLAILFVPFSSFVPKLIHTLRNYEGQSRYGITIVFSFMTLLTTLSYLGVI